MKLVWDWFSTSEGVNAPACFPPLVSLSAPGTAQGGSRGNALIARIAPIWVGRGDFRGFDTDMQRRSLVAVIGRGVQLHPI